MLGKQGDAFVLASETCALDIVGASFVRDIAPGEMVVISKNGINSRQPFNHKATVFVFLNISILPDPIVF